MKFVQQKILLCWPIWFEILNVSSRRKSKIDCLSDSDENSFNDNLLTDNSDSFLIDSS